MLAGSIELAAGLIFDETAAKLTEDNLAFFKLNVVGKQARLKPVLEVHQGLV